MVDSGLCRNTVNDRIGAIKRMFRWGVAEELFPASVLHRLEAVAGLRKGKTEARESKPIKPVGDDVVAATLVKLPAIPADMVRVQRLIGARPIEVCIMRPCDIDRSGEVWEYRPESHKTEHHDLDRIIMIGPEAQKVLEPYLDRAPTAYCFSPTEAVAQKVAKQFAARKTPLSCGNKPGTNRKRKPRRKAGACYDSNSYRRAIHRACDLAFPHPVYGSIEPRKVPPADRDEYKAWQSEHRWSPNRLRHTAATEIRKRFGIEAASVILGHTKVSTTEIYAERNTELARNIAAQLG